MEAYGERALVGVYGRDPSHAPVDAALMRLVRGLVPVPTVPGREPQDLRTLSEACAEADVLLDAIDRACLVHSDFNPKNC